MIDIIRKTSPISADDFLLTILAVLFLFVAVPIAVTFYLKQERRRRRSRKRSGGGGRTPQIGLAGDEPVERACEHERSKSRAVKKSNGSYVSVCKKCGAAMRRNGPGDWEIIQPSTS